MKYGILLLLLLIPLVTAQSNIEGIGTFYPQLEKDQEIIYRSSDDFILYVTADVQSNTILTTDCDPSSITVTDKAPQYNYRLQCTDQATLSFNKKVDNVFMYDSKINKKQELSVFGTEYQTGDAGRVFVQVIQNNAPVNNASCLLDIYKPDLTSLFIDVSMINLPDSEGLYFFDLAIPNETGIYMLSVQCKFTFIDFTYNNADFFPFISQIPEGVVSSGSLTGSFGALNQFDDSLYVEHDSASGNPKSAAFELAWNTSKAAILPENATSITLFYSGESNLVHTAEFYLFNFSSGQWVLLPNTLDFQDTAAGSPRGIAQFASSTLTGNVSNFIQDSIIKGSFNTTAGAAFTIFHNWFNVRLSSLATGSISEIRGGGELHVSNSVDNILGNLSSISVSVDAADIWNFENRTLTAFNFNVSILPNQSVIINQTVTLDPNLTAQLIGNETASFNIGVCSKNITTSLLMIVFLVIALLLIFLGILSNGTMQSGLGIIGGIMLLALSWYIAGCNNLIAYTLAIIGIISIIGMVTKR